MKLFEIPPSPPPRAIGKARRLRDYEWFGAIPFILIHVFALGGLFTGASWVDWTVCLVLFWARMFGVTAGYHRYFSHRTYKMSRLGQFFMALLAMSASQKGVLWWAAHHRDHHRYSDSDRDPHSPVKYGFWYSQIGWIFDRTDTTDYAKVKDLAKYPELVVLNKLWMLPPAILGVSVWLLFGWSGLWVGFMLSTAALWHATFTVNSFTHIFGSRRYQTTDDSRNSWPIALLTMGEGWHNNHHHFMGSTRQGFFWWEIDMSYYILKALSWVGVVWDIKEPPQRVYEDAEKGRMRATKVAQRAA